MDVFISRGSPMETPILELKTPWPLVNVEEKNGELAVSFHPDAFRWPCVEEVGGILLSLVDETVGSPFYLDFSNVECLTGLGLEKLALLNKQLHAAGSRLVIKNVATNVMKAFAAADFAKDFDISTTDADHMSTL
jgi:hypothetical protein